MGDIAVRRPATQLIVVLAAFLLLLAGASIGHATLAAAKSGHNRPVPAVIDAGTSNHLTITVKSASTEDQKHKGHKHGSDEGGDD
jgi:hypothetical protein